MEEAGDGDANLDELLQQLPLPQRCPMQTKMLIG